MTLTSIHAVDPVPLSAGGKLLSARAPLYASDSQAPGGPARPVAFAARAVGAPVFRVRLTAEGTDAGADYQLTATSGQVGPLFSGAVRLDGAGAQTVEIEVKLDQAPAGVVALLDEPIRWELRKGSAEGSLGDEWLRMELYFMPEDPGPSFPRGVAVEALRHLAEALGQRGEGRLRSEQGRFGTQKLLLGDGWSVAEVVQAIYQFNPPRYDIYQGAPHFTDISNFNNITLYYSRYQSANRDPNAIANCYDLAAVVQYLLRVGGIVNVRWAYMQPFGYLRKTQLVGRGQCNNPFYAAPGRPPTNPVVDPGYGWRTAFGNHAFCYVVGSQTLADATAGPHLGGESVASYVNVATDDQTPNPPAVRRGTPADISYWAGVGTVPPDTREERVTPFPPLENVEAFRQAVGAPAAADAAPGAAPKQFVAQPWPDLRQCPALGPGWALNYEELVPGYPAKRTSTSASRTACRRSS
jgi:hypothetical protein